MRLRKTRSRFAVRALRFDVGDARRVKLKNGLFLSSSRKLHTVERFFALYFRAEDVREGGFVKLITFDVRILRPANTFAPVCLSSVRFGRSRLRSKCSVTLLRFKVARRLIFDAALKTTPTRRNNKHRVPHPIALCVHFSRCLWFRPGKRGLNPVDDIPLRAFYYFTLSTTIDFEPCTECFSSVRVRYSYRQRLRRRTNRVVACRFARILRFRKYHANTLSGAVKMLHKRVSVGRSKNRSKLIPVI